MERWKIFKELLNRSKVGDLFSPISYDDNSGFYFLDDGAMGFGIEFQPQLGGDDEAMSKIKTLLNESFPNNTVVQFMLWKSPDISDKLLHMKEAKRVFGDTMMSKSLKDNLNARVEFFENSVHSEVEKVNHTRLCDIKGLLFVTFNNKYPQKPIKFTEIEVSKMYDIKSSLKESINASLNLGGVEILPEKLISIYRTFLLWDEESNYNIYNKGETRDLFLREYFTSPDYKLESAKDSVLLDSGKKVVKTFSVDRFPTETYADMPSFYLGDILSGHSTIPDNTLFNCTILYNDDSSMSSTINKKRLWANVQKDNRMLRNSKMVQSIAADLEEVQDSMSDGDRAVKMMFTVSLFSDNPSRAVESGTRLIQYFKTRKLGFDLVEDKYITLPLFLNQLPFNCELNAIEDLNRFRTMTTQHVSRMIPFQSDWKGSPTPVINTVSRSGQLMGIDLYDSDSSRNAIVVGESGGGKSFFINEIINSYLQTGAQVWVIDAGRSYENLCKDFHGDFVTFDDESKISLNPFAILNFDSDETDDDRAIDILAITDVIIAMASYKNELDDFQRTGLEKVLANDIRTYGSDYNIDYLIHTLSEHEDRRLRDLGSQLYPFSSEGNNGRWFTGKDSVTFRNNLTVLELDELSQNEHLQRVVLLQLISTIEQMVYQSKDRSKRSICIIDEAWNLLSEGTSIKRFIESAYRKFRKYNGTIITISQSASDLFANSSSKAIVANSPYKFLLKMQAQSVEELKDRKLIPLQDYEYSLIKSLTTIGGKFSEIYCITANSGNGVGRLIVDRYHQLLYSTNPEETTVLDEYQREGMSVSESIKAYIENHG